MGYIYTFLQFLGIGLIIFVPPIIPQSIAGQIVLLLSVGIGVWAIIVFRYTKLNIFPYLKDGAKLVRKGPYRFVRHPMYSAVILFALAYFIDNPNWIFGSLLVGIIVVLLFKMRFEEKQLLKSFKNYEVEFFNTYRIIPCIY